MNDGFWFQTTGTSNVGCVKRLIKDKKCSFNVAFGGFKALPWPAVSVPCFRAIMYGHVCSGSHWQQWIISSIVTTRSYYVNICFIKRHWACLITHDTTNYKDIQTSTIKSFILSQKSDLVNKMVKIFMTLKWLWCIVEQDI